MIRRGVASGDVHFHQLPTTRPGYQHSQRRIRNATQTFIPRDWHRHSQSYHQSLAVESPRMMADNTRRSDNARLCQCSQFSHHLDSYSPTPSCRQSTFNFKIPNHQLQDHYGAFSWLRGAKTDANSFEALWSPDLQHCRPRTNHHFCRGLQGIDSLNQEPIQSPLLGYRQSRRTDGRSDSVKDADSFGPPLDYSTANILPERHSRLIGLPIFDKRSQRQRRVESDYLAHRSTSENQHNDWRGVTEFPEMDNCNEAGLLPIHCLHPDDSESEIDAHSSNNSLRLSQSRTSASTLANFSYAPTEDHFHHDDRKSLSCTSYDQSADFELGPDIFEIPVKSNTACSSQGLPRFRGKRQHDRKGNPLENENKRQRNIASPLRLSGVAKPTASFTVTGNQYHSCTIEHRPPTAPARIENRGRQRQQQVLEKENSNPQKMEPHGPQSAPKIQSIQKSETQSPSSDSSSSSKTPYPMDHNPTYDIPSLIRFYRGQIEVDIRGNPLVER